MNNSFSEYILYEPILRILTSRNYKVECEVICPGMTHSKTGDKKKLYFVCKKDELEFALEVKWAKTQRVDISNDITKLVAYKASSPNKRSFLCVFGVFSRISKINNIEKPFLEVGNLIFADFKRTKYGCRIWEYIKLLTQY